MVETIGTRRGITPTIGKGVKRRNIRYNANDSVTDYSKGTKEYRDRYEELNRVKIADIAHYLGDDWIDWDCVKIATTNTTKNGGKVAVSSKLLRCIKCKEVYQTSTLYKNLNIGNRHIDGEPFVRLPLHRGDCGICG
tara:strand:+ start:1028 stop:1438 length:411 start_codon:yes stop_codon:yes gene_type:complete